MRTRWQQSIFLNLSMMLRSDRYAGLSSSYTPNWENKFSSHVNHKNHPWLKGQSWTLQCNQASLHFHTVFCLPRISSYQWWPCLLSPLKKKEMGKVLSQNVSTKLEASFCLKYPYMHGDFHKWFVEYKTLQNLPSAWGWVDDDWNVISFNQN